MKLENCRIKVIYITAIQTLQLHILKEERRSNVTLHCIYYETGLSACHFLPMYIYVTKKKKELTAWYNAFLVIPIARRVVNEQ